MKYLIFFTVILFSILSFPSCKTTGTLDQAKMDKIFGLHKKVDSKVVCVIDIQGVKEKIRIKTTWFQCKQFKFIAALAVEHYRIYHTEESKDICKGTITTAIPY